MMARGLATAAVAACLLLAGAGAVQVKVAAYDEPGSQGECFWEDVAAGNKLTGSFEVIAGGMLDIDATIYGPRGEAHYSVQRQRQGHFTVLAPAGGLYRLCFSNRGSTGVDKVVAFSLHTGDDLYRDIAKQEHISPLEAEITKLQDAVALVEDEQEYMWAREKASRELNEATHRRVLLFSVGQVALLLAVSAWQYVNLRGFFERKSKF